MCNTKRSPAIFYEYFFIGVVTVTIQNLRLKNSIIVSVWKWFYLWRISSILVLMQVVSYHLGITAFFGLYFKSDSIILFKNPAKASQRSFLFSCNLKVIVNRLILFVNLNQLFGLTVNFYKLRMEWKHGLAGYPSKTHKPLRKRNRQKPHSMT